MLSAKFHSSFQKSLLSFSMAVLVRIQTLWVSLALFLPLSFADLILFASGSIQRGQELFWCGWKHFEILQIFFFSVYKKSLERALPLLLDNAHTIRAFSRKIGSIVVKCHSQCFDFAMKDISGEYSKTTDSVRNPICKLSNHIPSAKWHKMTPLKAQRDCSTLWISTCAMLIRYVAIYGFFHQLDLLNNSDMLLQGDEHEVLISISPRWRSSNQSQRNFRTL